MLIVFFLWLQEKFLPYMTKWADAIDQRCDIPKNARLMMKLTKETYSGIITTGKKVTEV